MTPFEIVIPAISCITFVPNRQHLPVKKRYFICGYLAQPYKRMGTSKADQDLVHRWQSWRSHARLHLQAALFANGLYNNAPVSEEGWHVHVQPYHASGVHPDGTNILKGLEDILVCKQQSKGTFFFQDDKKLSGSYGPPLIDRVNPRLIVALTPPESFSPIKKEVKRMK